MKTKMFTVGPAQMYEHTLKVRSNVVPYFRTSEFSNFAMLVTPRIISFVSKISALYTKLIFLFTTKYFSMKLDFLMLQ